MLHKMLNQAQYELMHYPHKRVGYYLGLPANTLFGRNDNSNDRVGFANACLSKAMMDYYKRNINSEESKEILNIVKRYYDRWILTGKKLRSIEDAFAGMALLDLFQITSDRKYEKATKEIYNYILKQDTDNMGSFVIRTKEGYRYVYAEIIGCVCPFLAKYGKLFDDSGAVNMAAVQIENFLTYGMDEKTYLPYHGYNSDTQMKMGIIGWGQAVGKLLIGMSETLYYMDSEYSNYEIIRQEYRRIVDKVESNQSEGGLYHWQLSAKDGPADTAASAMILYSIAQSLENKILISIHRSRMMRGVDSLKACIQEDGSLPGCSAQAKGFNCYPVEFSDYPWGLGPAISLLTILEGTDTKNVLI